jgi:AraC family transcriptional regulator, transcriptional activator of pobA
MAKNVGRQADGTPVYAYNAAPNAPAVRVVRLGRDARDWPPGPGHAHAHDFLVVTYFERGGGTLRLGRREWPVVAGDVYVVAPGEVVGVGEDARGMAKAEGWALLFTPEALGSRPDAFLLWHTHPLLLPFVRGTSGVAGRLNVPPDERTVWSARCKALDRELHQRRDGSHEAVLAHLTLLLVDVSRLAKDIVADLRLNNEPLLAEVFGVIEARYTEPISLRDVADAVHLTSGYLTTLVREKTGRTVQAWIAERRMAQARRLLVETDLAVEEVGQRVGFRDPGYFVRSFRRAHDITPLNWRRAGRTRERPM